MIVSALEAADSAMQQQATYEQSLQPAGGTGVTGELRSSFLAGTAAPEFHAIGRVRSKSRATVEVEVIGGPTIIAAEIGIGEPGKEKPVLQITSPGKTPLPGLLEAGQLVSVRFPNGVPVQVQKINTILRFE